MNQSLSLYIYGNKIANEGYMPLVIVGEPRNLPDGVVGGLENLPYYFTLTIEATHTLFTLVRSDVSSIGSARGGRLKMAIALPKGTVLAGGISPLTVLKTINAYYDENYLSNGLMGRQFTETRENPEAFASILAQYPLIPVLMPHRVMTGQMDALIVAPEEQLALLMCDAQYPDFVAYHSIILSTSAGACALPRLSVAIPRPRAYALLLQQTKYQDIIDNGQTEIVLNISTTKPYEEPYQVNFTLQDAREGKVPYVTVDDVEETIRCTFPPKPRQKTFRLNLSTADGTPCPPPTAFYMKDHQDTSGRNRRPFSPQGTLTLVGPDTLWASPTIGCTDNNWTVSVGQPAIGPDGVIEYHAVARRIPVKRYRLRLKGPKGLVNTLRPMDFYLLSNAARDKRYPFNHEGIVELRGEDALSKELKVKTSRRDITIKGINEQIGTVNNDGTYNCCIEVKYAQRVITPPAIDPKSGSTPQKPTPGPSIPDWAKYAIGAGTTLLVIASILAIIFLSNKCSGDTGRRENNSEEGENDTTIVNEELEQMARDYSDSLITRKISFEEVLAKITTLRDSCRQQPLETELENNARVYSDTLKTLDFSFEEFLPKVKTLLDSCKKKIEKEPFKTLNTQYETMQAIHNELKKCKKKDRKGKYTVTIDELNMGITANLATYLNEGSGLTNEQSMILDSLIHEKPQGCQDTYLFNYYKKPMNSFSNIQKILQKGQKGKDKGKSLTDKGNQTAF